MQGNLDFHLCFDNGRDMEADFLELLAKNFAGKIDIGDRSKYGLKIGLLDVENEKEGGERRGYTFTVRSGVDKKTGFSVLVLDAYTNFPCIPGNLTYELFVDIFFESCRRLGPVYGFAYESEYGVGVEYKRPLMDVMEFYSDPYLFCVEPPFLKGRFDLRVLNRFFDSAGTRSKLSEIRKVMGRGELIALVKEHAARVFVSRAGVGVYKDTPGAVYPMGGPPVVYPRFFVRRELRRRGVRLPWGWSEEYAVDSDLHRREV